MAHLKISQLSQAIMLAGTSNKHQVISIPVEGNRQQRRKNKKHKK